jgi:hypothetical protein
MPPKKPGLSELELFRMLLTNMINMSHQLAKVANEIDWTRFDAAWGRFFTGDHLRQNVLFTGDEVRLDLDPSIVREGAAISPRSQCSRRDTSSSSLQTANSIR